MTVPPEPPEPLAPATERPWRDLLRPTPAKLLLVAGLLPALVVYGLNWRRGHYLDDARYDALSARDLFEVVGIQRTRPLGNLLTGATYVIGEPAGRLISALVLGAVAALAGSLVWRTCGARLAAVVSSLLVVYPALDFESALFWYAAILYPAGAAFGLAAGHCFLSTLRAPDRRSALVNGVACAALFAGAVACTEVAVNFLVLVPGLYLLERVGGGGPDRRARARLLATSAATVVAVGALSAFLFLPENEFTSSRGELVRNPLDGARRVFSVWLPQLQDLAYSRSRARIHAEALELGVADLGRPIALIVFAAAVVVGGLAVAAVRRPGPEPRAIQPPHAPRRALLLAANGIALFVLASIIPAALLSEQNPVTRLLFASWVGLALVAGAAVAALEGSPRPRRLGLATASAATMAAVLVLSLTVNGYGELFRRRDARDDSQVAAWAAVLATVDPVPGDVRAVNFYGRDQLLDHPSPLDNTFVGITELPWVMSLKLGEYRGGNAVGVPGGHPIVPVCMERMTDPDVLRVTSNFIDEVTPITSLLPAEMYEDRLVIIDRIRFGSTVVRFPLAERVPSDRYEHVQLETDGDRLCRSFGQTVP
ncbi:MAG: hypothetical protein ACR2HQ_15445 [Ilumatobacteraceae bacterium]